jgi:signal peptidase I
MPLFYLPFFVFYVERDYYYTMKRRNIILFSILFIGVLYVISSLTHVFKFMIIWDSNMLPSYKAGHWIIVSRLKKVLPNTVCLVPSERATGTENHELFLRVAGLEGDTIEINDGYLLRNGCMADSPNKLMFNYYFHNSENIPLDIFRKLYVQPYVEGDSVILCMDYIQYKKYSRMFKLHKVNKAKHGKENGIFGNTEANGWNTSNYGPVVVPRGCCFVLADNRDNCTDSRNWGFIPIKDVAAAVIGL